MEETVIQIEQMEALLGRRLTKVEVANYPLYLDLAIGELEDLLCIAITTPISKGLQLLIARCFAAKSLEQSSTTSAYNVTQKKVEDFSISMDGNLTPMETFVATNSARLKKYSRCQGQLRSGKVRNRGANCIRCV